MRTINVSDNHRHTMTGMEGEYDTLIGFIPSVASMLEEGEEVMIVNPTRLSYVLEILKGFWKVENIVVLDHQHAKLTYIKEKF